MGFTSPTYRYWLRAISFLAIYKGENRAVSNEQTVYEEKFCNYLISTYKNHCSWKTKQKYSSKTDSEHRVDQEQRHPMTKKKCNLKTCCCGLSIVTDQNQVISVNFKWGKFYLISVLEGARHSKNCRCTCHPKHEMKDCRARRRPPLKNVPWTPSTGVGGQRSS